MEQRRRAHAGRQAEEQRSASRVTMGLRGNQEGGLKKRRGRCENMQETEFPAESVRRREEPFSWRWAVDFNRAVVRSVPIWLGGRKLWFGRSEIAHGRSLRGL